MVFPWPRGHDRRVPKPQVAGSIPGVGYNVTFYMAQWIVQKGSQSTGCGFEPNMGYINYILYRKLYEKSTYF